MLDRLTDPLARIPALFLAAMFLVGALLADVHSTFDYASPADEPPQWVGRIGIMLYYAILPLACLGWWARRREVLGRTGRVAAWLVAPQVPAYAVLTVAAVLWGGLLGRGDLPGPVMVLEAFVFLFYLGVLVLGVAGLRARGTDAVVGLLLVIGLVLSFVMPFLLTGSWVALGLVVVLQGRARADQSRPERAVAA